LLYEVLAADAWPLMGVADFDDFNRRMLTGRATLEPRLSAAPVRMPLPPATRQGSIYENQAGSRRFFFDKART
jgi:phytanoyl-CoA hydroxylase